MTESLGVQLRQALERVCKWRMVLAGWHLGTKFRNDPGVAAMRDLREIVMILRMEQQALTTVLVEKGVITVEEFQQELLNEIAHTEKAMAGRFPGMRASDDGIVFYDPKLAAETMKRLGFPQ